MTNNPEISLFDLEPATSYEVVVNGTAQQNKVKIINSELHRWGGRRLGYTTEGMTIPANAKFRKYVQPHEDEGEAFDILDMKEGLVYETCSGEKIAVVSKVIKAVDSSHRISCYSPISTLPLHLDETVTCVGRVKN